MQIIIFIYFIGRTIYQFIKRETPGEELEIIAPLLGLAYEKAGLMKPDRAVGLYMGQEVVVSIGANKQLTIDATVRNIQGLAFSLLKNFRIEEVIPLIKRIRGKSEESSFDKAFIVRSKGEIIAGTIMMEPSVRELAMKLLEVTSTFTLKLKKDSLKLKVIVQDGFSMQEPIYIGLELIQKISERLE